MEDDLEDDLELSAVWESSLPVSSQVLKFQTMLFEEMGDDLEDISDVEIQIESSSLTKITRSTRSTRSTRVDNDRFLCGLLQQEKRSSSNMDRFN